MFAAPVPSRNGRSCAYFANSANSSGGLARGGCAAMGPARALPASHNRQSETTGGWLPPPMLIADRRGFTAGWISPVCREGGRERRGAAVAPEPPPPQNRYPYSPCYCVSSPALRAGGRALRARGWLCYSVARQTPLPSVGTGVKSSGPGRRCAGHAGWRSRAGDRCLIVCLFVCLGCA